MPGPDPFLSLAFPVARAFLVPVSAGVLAYGPGPAVELIPYFLGLVAWAGLAFAAVLLAPLSALLRRLRRARGAPPATHQPEAPAREPDPETTPGTASVPESPGEASHDRA